MLRSRARWRTSRTADLKGPRYEGSELTSVALVVGPENGAISEELFGAVALNLHGRARATEDLDIFIAPEDLNIDRLKAALRDAFDDPEIEQISAHDLLGEYPAVQYTPPMERFTSTS